MLEQAAQEGDMYADFWAGAVYDTDLPPPSEARAIKKQWVDWARRPGRSSDSPSCHPSSSRQSSERRTGDPASQRMLLRVGGRAGGIWPACFQPARLGDERADQRADAARHPFSALCIPIETRPTRSI